MNYEIIPLPKEKWKGTPILLKYTTTEYYDLESIENDDLSVHQHGTPLLIDKTEIITDVTNENEQRNSQTENTSLITNPQEKNDLTRTMQDEILLKKYPIAYKKIMDSLRHSSEVVGEKGVTANAIYENIKHIARIDRIE